MRKRLFLSLLLVVALAAAVIFFGYRFWLADDYKRIGELRGQLAQKNQQIRQEQDIVAKLPQLEAEIARLRQTLADLKEILPTEPETGEMLKWFKNLADQSNLDLKDFTTEALRTQIRRPLLVTETAAQFDVLATVAGGGVSGQAGAVRLGIARALVEYNLELRKRLKTDGLLTRDARAKERKKYGMAGARKRFQFSKR